MISRVGKDDIGRNIIQNLEDNDVSTIGVEEDENVENDYSILKSAILIKIMK